MAVTIDTKHAALETSGDESPVSSFTEKPSKIVENDEEEDSQILTGAKLHIIIFGLGLAVFLMALDMSILVTAIPLITEKFHSTADIGWYMSAYALSM
jgi:tetraacyldisaccharide-1-P 4'-kinase